MPLKEQKIRLAIFLLIGLCIYNVMLQIPLNMIYWLHKYIGVNVFVLILLRKIVLREKKPYGYNQSTFSLHFSTGLLIHAHLNQIKLSLERLTYHTFVMLISSKKMKY